jgi:hypothetical protein
MALWLGRFVSQATQQLTPSPSVNSVVTLWTHWTALPLVAIPVFRPAASGSGWGSALCCLSPRASDEFFLFVPRLPSWPQGHWGMPLALRLLPFEHDNYAPRGAPNRTYDFHRILALGQMVYRLTRAKNITWVHCTLPSMNVSVLDCPRGLSCRLAGCSHLAGPPSP